MFGHNFAQNISMGPRPLNTHHLRFFEDRRSFFHTLPAIISGHFLKFLSPDHLRSGLQIKSSDPTSYKFVMLH